jgi:hypothetical protein
MRSLLSVVQKTVMSLVHLHDSLPIGRLFTIRKVKQNVDMVWCRCKKGIFLSL